MYYLISIIKSETAEKENNCILTPLSETDFGDMRKLLSNEEVRKYLGGVRPFESSLNGLRNSIQADNEYPFTVRLLSENMFIGYVTIAPHHDPNDMEISYMFLPDYWGNGYAREAINFLLEICKNELKLSRVVSETQSENMRSCHLLESLGYYAERSIARFGALQTIYVFNFTERWELYDERV